MEIIRRAADIKCSGNIQLTVEIVDSLIGNPITSRAIKSLFGLAGLQHNEDFASILEVCGLLSFTLTMRMPSIDHRVPPLYVESPW